MFEEIDTDKNGYLTFDEFQKLLSKLELGISHNELGLLINEADDDHNGVVDYKVVICIYIYVCMYMYTNIDRYIDIFI
jgi:Ca2+-binding EF-hand superfamily protein